MDASARTARRIDDDPQQWAEDVRAALLRQLTEPTRHPSATGAHVLVERSWVDVQGGHPVLHVIYRRPGTDLPIGLRRHLDEVQRYPLNLPIPDVDPVTDLADDIADGITTLDVGELLESAAKPMACDEDGVWWWGHPPLPADARR